MRESPEARWAAVAKVVLALGDELSVKSLGRRGLQQTIAIFGAEAAAIYLLVPEERRLRLLTQEGFPTSFIHEIQSLSLDVPTISTRAAVSGELQIVADVAQLPAEMALNHRMARELGLRSMAAVPLRARGQLVGVMSFATRQLHHFDQSEMAIIEVLAHALGSGILNARAFEAERRMRLALEAVDEATLGIAAELEPRRVLKAIVDRAREVTGARYAALGIGTDPTKQFDPWVFSGIDEELERKIGRYPRPLGFLGAVPAEGKVIRQRDMTRDPRFQGWPAHHPPMHSFMGVPIRLRDEVVGNLYLTEKTGAAEFSTEDERAVASLAAHAAIAYRHAQLYQEVQQERNRLGAVVEGSPLGILFLERATGHVYANHAAEQMLGKEFVPSLGIAQYLDAFRRPDGTELEVEELPSTKVLRGEEVIGTELLLVRPDSNEITVLVNAAPIRDAQGQITGAVVMWQDISPLKLERLREEFISVVAHELRAPITVIAGYADFLSRGKRDEKERRAMESIRVSARRLERLVQDLLDASRIEARRLQLDMRPVDVGALVEEVVDRLRGVLTERTVRVEVRDASAPVAADPGRIEQVLTNLLTNAAKYSPPDTEIGVVVAGQPGEIHVSVHNEGPGIAEDDLARLFTRFYRTRAAQEGKAPGLGLGLYITRGLVEAQDGRIWADSKPGQGTTFTFALPTI